MVGFLSLGINGTSSCCSYVKGIGEMHVNVSSLESI